MDAPDPIDRDELERLVTRTVFDLIVAVADVIRDLGEVPAGELYARVMNELTLANFEGIVTVLEKGGLVRRDAHVLRWVGPAPTRDTAGRSPLWR